MTALAMLLRLPVAYAYAYSVFRDLPLQLQEIRPSPTLIKQMTLLDYSYRDAAGNIKSLHCVVVLNFRSKNFENV